MFHPPPGRLLLLSAIFCFLTSSALAQYGASLEGTVSDKTGAVVSGAKVSVTNQETGVAYGAVTNDSGFYRVSALVPGRYTAKAEAVNFKAKTVTNIPVSAEDAKNQDFSLELGAASESMTVTANAVSL